MTIKPKVFKDEMHSIPGEKSASTPTTQQGPDVREGGVTEAGDVPLNQPQWGVSLNNRACPPDAFTAVLALSTYCSPCDYTENEPKIVLSVWTRLHADLPK